MKITFSSKWLRLISALTVGSSAVLAHAEYHNFNTASGADGIIQEVRWPYWAESTYNAIYSQTISGGGGSCYFYGGMPSDPNGNPPCSIIWSFWPPSGTVVPGAAVTAYWTASNMYAPPHVGEGASGKASGKWPLITTNRWYREVLRIWQPADGTPNLAFTGRWLRDPATSNWYHLATMKIPFGATGLDGLSGFQEDFSHGNRNPRRTDYRNVYYHRNGAWTAAKLFTPSVRQLGESGTCGLIENSTAAFFETCSGSSYLFNVTNNLPPTTGNLFMLVATNHPTVSLLTNKPPGITTIAAINNYAAVGLNIANQPNAPDLDPIIVTNATASAYGQQVIVAWQMPPTSAPQLAYVLEVFDNPAYSGAPALTVFEREPETRQRLLNVGAVATPYVRLQVIDIFDRTNAPVLLAPSVVALNVATNPPSTVSGLGYKYYESATSYYWQYNGINWATMPNFNALTPVYQGAVSYPDLTPRRRRNGYAFNYTGFITVPADGLYTFTLRSCAGTKLYLDGALIINHDGNHSPSELSGWAALASGRHAVNLQYFFDTQNSDAGDLTDQLALSYEGPGLPSTEVPSSAWSRVPAAGEPGLTLTSPGNGSTIVSSNVVLTASVVTNATTVNKVQFYVGESFWGQTTVPPYLLTSFFWSAPSNSIRARLFYNTSFTLDSPLSFVTTTNPPLAPWLLAGASEHVQPFGAKIDGGIYTLIGDGLNLLCRPVDGNCTIIARVSGITSTAAAPDGTTPDWSWEAGLIMRESTNATPGTPLGNGGTSQYAAVFATVNNDTRYQDNTMENAGGPYWSSGLGGQRWLKLQRAGTVFTTSVSTDGVNWTAVRTNTLSGISTRLYVGMFTYAAPSQNPNVHWASFDSVSITGSIVGPPGVSVSPQTETAYTGQSATFTALPSGNPPFAYQWQLNGIPLTGATAASLTLTNLQPTNSGLFRVVLSNASGSVTSSVATLNVLTPPPYFSQTLATGPLAYWRLNDAGPIAADAIGSRDGTGQGGVAFGAVGVGAPFAGFEPGNLSAQFNGTDSSVAIPAFNLNTTNFTFSGWVRRNGTQVSWSGVVFCRSGATVAGVHFGTANELRYTWNDGGNTYNWNSGLTVPDNQWTFFALTIEPTRAIMYRGTNSILRSTTNNVTHAAQTFPGTTYFGYDPNSSTRRLNGFLDEVALFNRTLTPPEIAALFSASQTALPAVQLSSPGPGAVFPGNTDLPLAATVTTNGHAISKVQFFNGPILLGETATAPFSLVWSNVPMGQYTLLAQVTYDGNAVMSSIPVNITVTQPLLATPGLTVVANGANLDLTLTGTVGGHYRVDSRTDLVSSWQVFADFASLAVSPFTLSAPMTNGQQFFRAVGLP